MMILTMFPGIPMVVVDYSAPKEDMVTFKNASAVFFILVESKGNKQPQFF